MASLASTTVLLPGCGGAGSQSQRGRRRCVARASALAVGTTHYEVLGVGAGATRGEIKAAYRRLAREVHPDAAAAAAGGCGDEDFIRLHAAYATLADPDERARYDRSTTMAAIFRRAPPSSSGFRTRTWETDQCW
ncbi:hypothetical protein PR202_gb28472 [Eleusine coracana subsp. coracana]|uniref:J domain-containing protein n=1 Tax=Eleusine coracana subsp. coracana TaxID=191504 RepID=A0AAV5FXU2_ELECO|nr:hypothetical protein QOZ80_6AG0550950 [Eleusine coracana subsp. coracana]GJN39360.1 hypothetical protein PR202_gb28472 [Eleusine coracana subsp. coracana]